LSLQPLTFGSLFAGIGGFEVGLERAGMIPLWQVEINHYDLRVLAKDWPEVPKYRDVRYFLGSKKWRRARRAWEVDVIAGGFPCQDISLAGRGAGLEGERSSLWFEFARILGLLRPHYVVVENVEALVERGLARVISDLAELGYTPEWDVISALSVGAPHRRRRLWIVAHAHGQCCSAGRESTGREARRNLDRCGASNDLSHPNGKQSKRGRGPRVMGQATEPDARERLEAVRCATLDRGADSAHSHRPGKLQQGGLFGEGCGWIGDGAEGNLPYANG
jgi:DNA-cytosine methyltransferase